MITRYPDGGISSHYYGGNHFTIPKCIKSKHCIPSTYTRLYVNYISIKLEWIKTLKLKWQLSYPNLLPSNIPHSVNGILQPPTSDSLLSLSINTQPISKCWCPLQSVRFHHPCCHQLNTSQTPQWFPTMVRIKHQVLNLPSQATLPVPSRPAATVAGFCFSHSHVLFCFVWFFL